jgi:hypothetical protein
MGASRRPEASKREPYHAGEVEARGRHSYLGRFKIGERARITHLSKRLDDAPPRKIKTWSRATSPSHHNPCIADYLDLTSRLCSSSAQIASSSPLTTAHVPRLPKQQWTTAPGLRPHEEQLASPDGWRMPSLRRVCSGGTESRVERGAPFSAPARGLSSSCHATKRARL